MCREGKGSIKAGRRQGRAAQGQGGLSRPVGRGPAGCALVRELCCPCYWAALGQVWLVCLSPAGPALALEAREHASSVGARERTLPPLFCTACPSRHPPTAADDSIAVVRAGSRAEPPRSGGQLQLSFTQGVVVDK